MEIEGQRVEPRVVEVAPGLRITVFEAADPERLLARAVREPGIDPYAGILWPTSLALAARLAGEVSAGDRVLDVGAGTGLASLTAARLGARVVALDHDRLTLRRIAAAATAQRLEVTTRRFDLHAREPLPPAELVVLGDVLYETALARSAARRAAEAVARGSRVLVGDPGRAGRETFVRALARHGIEAVFDDVRVRLPGDAHPATVGIARPARGPG